MSTARERIALNLNAVKSESLENVNVNLALTDDLKASVTVLQSENSKLLKSIENFQSAYKAMQSQSSMSEKIKSEQGKLTSLTETKAKELGVPVGSIPGYSDALKAWGLVDSTIDKIKEF